jgi:MFS family permease
VAEQQTTSRGVIWLTLFLDLVGFSIVFPVFAELIAFYLGRDDGLLAAAMGAIAGLVPSASQGQVEALLGSLLFALFTLAQFLAAPLWGLLSDRIGRRPVMLISIAGNLAAYLLWAVAGHFWLLLISRLLAGCMSGNIAVATAAMADITPRDKRTAAMGLVGMAFGLGMICGPAIGGLSWHFLPQPASALTTAWFQLTPFTGVALVAAALSAINLLWAWRRFAETRNPAVDGSGGRSLNPLRCFTQRLAAGLSHINVAYCIFMICFAGMEATLVFVARDLLGFGPGAIGALFVWFGLISAAVQGGLVRPLAKRIDDRRLSLIGMAVQVPGYVVMALLPHWPSTLLIVAGSALLTSGMGLCMPGLTALVSKRVDDEHQGQALGIFRSAGSIGRALGPVLAGLLYFLIDPAAPYWLGAVALALPMLLIARLPK